MHLQMWDDMVNRVCTEACSAEARSQTGWLLLAENREWWAAHMASFVQRVLLRHQIRRPPLGRFMLQPFEESDAAELSLNDA